MKSKFSHNNLQSLIFCLAIAAVSLSFLFGFWASASAVGCGDAPIAAGQMWHKEPSFSCTMTFGDNGGSLLQICKYRFINNGSFSSWVDLSSFCKGQTTYPSNLSVSVGSDPANNCFVEGGAACSLEMQATDNSGNSTDHTFQYDIDYTAPATLVGCNGAACSTNWYNQNVSVLLYTNTTAGSNDTLYACQDQNPGSPCTPVEVATGSPNVSYSLTVSQEGVTYVRYYSKDAAGHTESQHTAQIFLDQTAPSVYAFSASPQNGGIWVSTINPALISWGVADFPSGTGSGINHYELWRAPDSSGSPGAWAMVQSAISQSATSTTDAPPSSGTWWYGLHAVDNAGNCINEQGGHCGGVSSDSLDNRSSKGPKNIKADISSPQASITSPATGSSVSAPKFNATFQYSDSGGSNLALCQYRVQSNGTTVVDWTSVTCFGAGPVSVTQKITVGKDVSNNCHDGGIGACVVSVQATDIAGNNSGIISSSFTTSLNQSPALSSVSALPNSVPVGSNITFSGTWSDPDSTDTEQFFACKTSSVPSGGNCAGGNANTWCKTASGLPANGSGSCAYTAQSSDVGTPSYWAFVCDNSTSGNACSSPQQGTFTVFNNHPPTATNLSDNHTSANYCFVSSPPIIVSWVFHDIDPGDHESTYQVQVDTSSSFNSNRGSPLIDSGSVAAGGTITDGTLQSYAPVGLSYATTYYWRVQVWDSYSVTSGWATGSSFQTAVHAYPSPDFTFLPAFPAAKQQVQFTDQTIFAAGSTSKSWLWNFGDSSSSTVQNPTHTYSSNAAYGVSLQSSDNAGSCIKTKSINVGSPFPQWQEISPF